MRGNPSLWLLFCLFLLISVLPVASYVIKSHISYIVFSISIKVDTCNLIYFKIWTICLPLLYCAMTFCFILVDDVSGL